MQTRGPELIVINKEKRTCTIVGVTLPADYRENVKDNDKLDKYLDLERELRKI